MIAVDTNSLASFLKNEARNAVDRVAAALTAGNLILPPVVVTEILSDPLSAKLLDSVIPEIEILQIKDGFWARAGRSRRAVKQHGFKATIADTLIAQSCIDHDVALITGDDDFRHFVKHCGLKLA